MEGRFASLGPVPSYLNKSLRWTLDLPSVLKWSTSACFPFGHFLGHIQSRKSRPAWDRFAPASFLPCSLATDQQLLARSSGRREDNSWCFHDVMWRKRKSGSAVCLFSAYLLGCSARSLAYTILDHRGGKYEQSDLVGEPRKTLTKFYNS